MTAAAVPFGNTWRLTSGRLLRLELRRNAMMWLVPLVVLLYWFGTYKRAMMMPPIWSARTMPVRQGMLLVDCVPFVVGAAAWMGAREGRRGTAEQVMVTALPRWAGRLTTWAATTCWALLAYGLCIGLLYGRTATERAVGSPMWWPVTVCALGVVALSAVGYALGVWLPSRFTAPLAAIAALILLLVSRTMSGSVILVLPVRSPVLSFSPQPEDGIFYHYLPDVSLVQSAFAVGAGLAALAAVALRGEAGRRVAATVGAGVGVALAVVAVVLAGTAKVQVNGVKIPALHDPSYDRPIAFTPVCQDGVCLHPAFGRYLPAAAAVLAPAMRQVAGLPGAPLRAMQSQWSGDGAFVKTHHSANSSVLDVQFEFGFPGWGCLAYATIPCPPDGFSAKTLWANTGNAVGEMRPMATALVIDQVIGHATPAQQAAEDVLMTAAGTPPVAARDVPPPGAPFFPSPPAPASPVAAAVKRFAALSPEARHAWLTTHLTALKAGQITPEQLP